MQGANIAIAMPFLRPRLFRAVCARGDVLSRLGFRAQDSEPMADLSLVNSRTAAVSWPKIPHV